MTTKRKLEFPFKIGADPEFNVILKDNRIPADKIMKLLFAKEDYTGSGYKIAEAGEIGWDGHCSTGELRPAPSNNPKKLTKNIGQLFAAMNNKSQLFDISTCSDKAPIGGHIHLELPTSMVNETSKMTEIHKKIALFYIPVMLGEDLANSKLRMKHGYGKLADYNIQAVSNDCYTYEFRCPNAEWLTTPKITQATLAYMATIYNEVMNNPENLKNIKDITIQNQSQIKALQELALTKYIMLVKSMLAKIKKHVRTFEYYETYKEEIDYIFTPQRILRDKEKVNFEITKGWKMTGNKVPTKRALLSEEKMKKLASKLPIDEITSAIAVPHNPDDTRCIDFAKSLKDRIIAYGWKMKRNYFIFGLRKGMKNYIVTNGNFELIIGKDIKKGTDLGTVINIMSKMLSKYQNSLGKNLTQEEKKDLILVGIPYEKRIGLETKEFLMTIHNIETDKEKIQPQEERDRLENDDEVEGEIYKIYNRETTTTRLVDTNTREQQQRLQDEHRKINQDLNYLEATT